jgi:outer membrane protein insertion porin family
MKCLKRALFLFLVACGGAPASVVVPPSKPAKVEVVLPNKERVRVRFEGLRQVPEQTLRDVVEIDKPDKSRGVSNEDVLERDTLLISATFYDLGYVQAKVDEPKIEVAADGAYEVTFKVEEGVRFRLGKLEIREKDPKRAPLGSFTHSKAGEWFSRKLIVRDVQAITRIYRDLGYAHADVAPETQIDLATRIVDLAIVIDRGPVMTFERVRFDPPEIGPLVTALAKREGVVPGARYNETNLEAVKAALDAQNVRAAVSIKDAGPDRVEVMFEAR